MSTNEARLFRLGVGSTTGSGVGSTTGSGVGSISDSTTGSGAIMFMKSSLQSL